MELATTELDLHFMQQALRLAEQAYEAGEVPVGALVVWKHRILGKGWNQVETLQDPTAHAEMLAITAACQGGGGKYLPECTLYVTLEPCVMCAGAMKWTQVGRLVYGASDEKYGFTRKAPEALHPKTQVSPGVLAEACAELLKAFFREKRLGI
ncbi:MAG: nucleoside deaminase [Bacteroidetes bacterium]|nr:nucleoside deaminase [Bacteroidota bacterium]